MIIDLIPHLFLGSVLGLLGLYFLIYNKVATYSKDTNDNYFNESVSIIIASRNELENLEQNLPILLAQEYSDYEIIIVDDHSTDGSGSFVRQLAVSNEHLSYYSLSGNDKSSKKTALALGIKKAKNEYLLFTDADCTPAGEQWLSGMVNCYSEKIQIVLGYGPYRKSTGIVNIMARVDTFFIALQYFAFSLMGIPYMGVGRNLSYRKSLYTKGSGFTDNQDLLSGDDDLFIQANANKTNVAVCMEESSFTYSITEKSLWNLFLQKRRHTSAGFRYKNFQIVLLGLIQLINAFFYFALFALILSGNYTSLMLLFTFLKFSSQWFVLKKCCQRLGEQDLLLFSLIFEMPIIFLNFLASFSNLVIKNSKWN